MLDTTRQWHIAHMNLMTLYQERFQDIQEFRVQYMAMRKVCDELGLKLRKCEDDVRAVLKEKVFTKPTNVQLKRLLTRLKRSIMKFLFYTRPTKRNMEN